MDEKLREILTRWRRKADSDLKTADSVGQHNHCVAGISHLTVTSAQSTSAGLVRPDGLLFPGEKSKQNNTAKTRQWGQN